ncbi:MAG: DUF11 domain-containing protein [candidate division NC10 bacterium]|nr:DUF11 domain-containing protein [candidate division NC10 bacterium]
MLPPGDNTPPWGQHPPRFFLVRTKNGCNIGIMQLRQGSPVTRFIIILALVLSALPPIALWPGKVEAQSPQITPKEGRAARTGVSPPTRFIRPPAVAPTPGEIGPPREIPIQPFRSVPRPKQKPAAPLSQAEGITGTPALPTPNIPAPTTTFEGLSNADNIAVHGGAVLPPDPNGDVGPNHYVQSVNLLFRVFQKNGAPVTAPLKLSSLFAGAPTSPCATRDDGDPIVLYDHLADRWLISQFARVAPISHQCIAISQTGDPSGSYFVYDFAMLNTKDIDYPKFGVWPDAYYMTDNQFNALGFAGAGAFAFDRTKMLAGDPTASFIYFDLAERDPTIGGMLPADLDGPLPPAGAPGLFAYFTADEFFDPEGDALRIFEFHADFGNPANSSFIEQSPVVVALFDPNLCGFLRNCIPQPGTAVGLDAISDRLMHRLQYRNFGSHETLVVNHTVDADGTNHAGVRYYELHRTSAGPGFGEWSIHEQATFAPDAVHRWMGSAALDQQGNLAVGFSASDNATFPSIRYAGRLASDPPGGLFQGEATLRVGAGSQTDPSSRWGDYSMLAVDPSDGCTFWYTNSYYAATSSSGWQTRIGSFAFPSCLEQGEADLSVTKSASADPVGVRSPLTYTLTATNLGPDPATGVTLTDTLPAGVGLVAVTTGTGACSVATGTVTCLLGVLASGASAIVTIRVTTPASPGTIVNTASISAQQTDPDPANNSVSLTTSVLGAELTGAFNPGSLIRRCNRTGLVCTLSGAFTLQNQGLVGVRSLSVRTAQVQLYLSDDGILSPASDRLLRAARMPIPAPGQARAIAFRVRTGPSLTGQFLIAAIDPGNVVPETNKTDNLVIFGPLP